MMASRLPVIRASLRARLLARRAKRAARGLVPFADPLTPKVHEILPQGAPKTLNADQGDIKDLTAMALVQRLGWRDAIIVRTPSGDGAILSFIGEGANGRGFTSVSCPVRLSLDRVQFGGRPSQARSHLRMATWRRSGLRGISSSPSLSDCGGSAYTVA